MRIWRISMREKRKNRVKEKYNGYLILEILICLFLFFVSILVLSVFLRRVALIEKIKSNEQKIDENMNFLLDRITEDITDRDMTSFNYEGKEGNIYLGEEEIIYRKKGSYYKIEYKDKKLYISEGDALENLGSKGIVGEFDNLELKEIHPLLVISVKSGNRRSIRIINLI